MNTQTINIGKGITMEVDRCRFNTEVMDHIVSIGLRNLLGDAHAGATAKSDPTGYIAKSRELAERTEPLQRRCQGRDHWRRSCQANGPCRGGHPSAGAEGRAEGSREGPCCSGQGRSARVAQQACDRIRPGERREASPACDADSRVGVGRAAADEASARCETREAPITFQSGLRLMGLVNRQPHFH